MKKVAVITGASGGIGEQLAHQFAKTGNDLLLVARSGKKLDTMAQQLSKNYKVEVAVLALDLTAENAIETLVTYLQDNDLQVKHMVNNAGFGLNGPMQKLSLDEQINMVDLNVRVLTDLSIRFLDQIIIHKGGVMNVASTISFMPAPFMGVYAASKAYVLSLTESLAEENKTKDIKISAICPGTTETGFSDRAELGRSELFDRAPKMSAHAVAEIGFNGYMRGQTIVVTGTTNSFLPYILRVVPRWVARRVIGRLMNTER